MNTQYRNHICPVLSEEDTQAFAGKLALATKPGVVIYLSGSLGAGKTTFTRGFLRALGYQGKVKSPTYTLVEPYEMGDMDVFHFDLYRLNSSNELREIGIGEYFSDESICLIEWPEKGDPLLPAPDLTCYIEKAPSGRTIRVVAQTQSGDEILARL